MAITSAVWLLIMARQCLVRTPEQPTNTNASHPASEIINKCQIPRYITHTAVLFKHERISYSTSSVYNKIVKNSAESNKNKNIKTSLALCLTAPSPEKWNKIEEWDNDRKTINRLEPTLQWGERSDFFLNPRLFSCRLSHNLILLCLLLSLPGLGVYTNSLSAWTSFFDLIFTNRQSLI